MSYFQIILYTFSCHCCYETGNKRKRQLLLTTTWERDAKYSEESVLKNKVNGVKVEELPFFKFEVLSNATSNFDSIHKLGQGGFGPVHKVFLLF